MNILQIRGEFSDNGPGTQSLTISKQLRKRGHKVFMISGGGHLQKKIKESKIPYLRISEISYESRNLVNILKAIIKIRIFLKENDIEIIHGHNAAVIGICNFASIGLTKKIKFFQSCRGLEIRRFYGFRNMIYHLIKLNKIFAVSEYTKNNLMSFGVKSKKIEVTYNGTDLERFDIKFLETYRREIRSEYNIPDDAFVIGIIGRMDGIKGHRDLIKVVNYLSKRHKKIYAILVGDGKEFEDNVQLVKKLKLENRIIFTGLRLDSEKLHAAFDVFTLLSKQGFEMFPNVIVEAMTYGKPFLSVNTTGIPEMAKDGEGIICECNDFDSYCYGFEKLISNRELREKMGRKGRRSVEEKFNISSVVDKIENCYLNS